MIITIGETFAYRIEDVMLVNIDENNKRIVSLMFKGGTIRNLRFDTKEIAKSECKKVIQFMFEADEKRQNQTMTT